MGKLECVFADFEGSQPRKIEHMLRTSFNVLAWIVSCFCNSFKSLLIETWMPCLIDCSHCCKMIMSPLPNTGKGNSKISEEKHV